MRIALRLFKWLVLLVVAVIIAGAGYIYLMPPEILRLANAFAAKTVCSNFFIAGRDPQHVLAEDVQAPGHPLLKYVSVAKQGNDAFSARLFGFLATEYAVFRPGLGCTSVADHDLDKARSIRFTSPEPQMPVSDFEWPLGDTVSMDPDPAILKLVSDPVLAGPGMRAIVVVRDGRIAAEVYGTGFNADTALAGWSMTKTVTGALVARRVGEGKLTWDRNKLFASWSDGRAAIRIADLMAMQSGLDLDESYGDVNDVTRMLFLAPDQAGYVLNKGLETDPGKKFEYTTGSAIALTRAWMDGFAEMQDALDYPRKALFKPLGMRSAVMETDERGTFSGGSLMFATARDWARFGLLLADRGEWAGEQLLPEEYFSRVSMATALSGGLYTEALSWKTGTGDAQGLSTKLPADAFWALGHDGQSILIVPSEHLVVVRLGLTPEKLKYSPVPLAEKIAEAVAQGPATTDEEAAPAQ